MARTSSNMAHKSEFHADFILRNFSKSLSVLQFRVPMFGGLYLPNQAEPTQAPFDKVVVLTSIFNFVNYTMNQITTVWEL